MKEQGKWYITVENERIEVTEDVYHTYWHYTEKEKYFMGKLKKGKFVSDQEKEVAEFIPSREDSLERLEERGIKFPDTVSLTPEETLYKKELYSFLKTALSALTDEEFNLIQELFYLEKTEREVAALLHTAASTINYRKHKVLAKLRKLLEKNL